MAKAKRFFLYFLIDKNLQRPVESKEAGAEEEEREQDGCQKQVEKAMLECGAGWFMN